MGSENYWARLGRRRVSRRRFLVGGGVAAAGSAALLAGCGDDSPAPTPVATEAPATETPTPTTPEATPSPPPTPSPTAIPTPDPDAPRRGGTLRLWKPYADGGLDPGISYHNRDVMYSTLTQPLTYQPSKNLFAMDGMVGYEQVDPLTLVWSIRPGMQFHNGDPVDSEAVAFSFGRLARLWEAVDTHVDRRGFDFVDSFEATDELTLTEHWRRTNADALVHRARHYYSFLNPRVVEAQGVLEGTYTAPDGTLEDVYSIQDLPFGSGSGPYVLTKRDETGTRVERWPDYHRHTPADDGFVEDGPYIDAWEKRVMPEYASRKAAFLAGDLDVYGSVDPLELHEFEGQDHVNVVETLGGGYAPQGMDGAKFHDKRARQALQKAIDYEGFIEAIHPQGGQYAAPISNLLPHFQQLSQEQLTGWFRYDPGEARALWEAAEFEIPIEALKVLQTTDGTHYGYDATEFVARSLHEALGIGTEFYQDHSCWAPASLIGAFGAGPRSCWGVTYADGSGEPAAWDLYGFGRGEGGATTGIPHDTYLRAYDPQGFAWAFNHSLQDTVPPEINRDAHTLTGMLAAQQAETDPEDRAVLLMQVQRWILDNAWAILPLPISSVQHYAVSFRLRDFAPNDWLNGYGLRRESMWLTDG